MRHSHVHGWAPSEIGLFIDQHLRAGTPLPQLGKPECIDGRATATYSTTLPIKRSQFHFTNDSGPLVQRRWKSVDAALDEQRISAQVPHDATIWMLSVTDTRDAMITTGVVFSAP